ncbi:uncharacterized protein LOC134252316 [Saccostrea cucullata]|uniref:uncharacterized protein LOC134252316 n=1 Tax=Saccostrea cuccullata TaxID=36930 RepID=UPI002ED3F6DF
MATESEIPCSVQEEYELQNEERRISFPPTDVILEVEGTDIHLNKQMLMDNSPVFKVMFESDFSEKHKDRISLPGKKYADFVNFLYTFYNPELLAPLTKKNVLAVVSLADEYQIMNLKDKCESFILEDCKRACGEGNYRIETETLLDYAACSEEHNLTLVLPLIKELCSKHSFESLKEANIDTKVTADMRRNILETRCALMEQEIVSSLDKGEKNILKLMELAWEAQYDSKMETCENRLVANCKLFIKEASSKIVETFSKETIIDYIIAAERYELKNLLSCAVELASKCNSTGFKNGCKYNEITSLTKYEIDTKRLNFLEKNCRIDNSYNLFPQWGMFLYH